MFLIRIEVIELGSSSGIKYWHITKIFLSLCSTIISTYHFREYLYIPLFSRCKIYKMKKLISFLSQILIFLLLGSLGFSCESKIKVNIFETFSNSVPNNNIPSGNQFRKRITISQTMQGDDSLIQFPILVKIAADNDIKDRASSDGHDIYFTDFDGVTKLAHEIEKYNSLTGEVVAWVKMPTLLSTQDQSIFINYGNPLLPNQEERSLTWSNTSFSSVWHLNEDPSLTSDGHCSGSGVALCDSTGQNNHATTVSLSSTDQKDGKISGSIEFNNSADEIDYTCAGCPNTYPFSISLWFMNPTGAFQGTLFAYDLGPQKALAFSGGSLHVGIASQTYYQEGFSIADPFNNASGALLANTWYHLVVVYNSGDRNDINPQARQVYLNGVDVTVLNSGNWWNSFGFSMGRRVGGSALSFTGSLDEVRVHPASLTANQVISIYNNQNDPESFMTVSGEELY
jgi:hypothetical protein